MLRLVSRHVGNSKLAAVTSQSLSHVARHIIIMSIRRVYCSELKNGERFIQHVNSANRLEIFQRRFTKHFKFHFVSRGTALI
jgi:hypothetical protein